MTDYCANGKHRWDAQKALAKGGIADGDPCWCGRTRFATPGALDGQAALDEANNMVVRLRESLRDVLSLIADEDSGDGKSELIRDTSRDDAPDYLPRMMRLVKILATATALAGETHAAPSTVGRAGSDAVARDPQGDSGPMTEA